MANLFASHAQSPEPGSTPGPYSAVPLHYPVGSQRTVPTSQPLSPYPRHGSPIVSSPTVDSAPVRSSLSPYPLAQTLLDSQKKSPPTFMSQVHQGISGFSNPGFSLSPVLQHQLNLQRHGHSGLGYPSPVAMRYPQPNYVQAY